MSRNVLLFISFGCLGITTEVFFTSVSDTIANYIESSFLDLKLQGHSYIWMFFIYGFGALLFRPIYQKLIKLPTLVRICMYAFIIILIEFFTGFLLDKLTGTCPWHYTEGLHVMGYARLDYYPFWIIFSFLMEKIYAFLIRVKTK